MKLIIFANFFPYKKAEPFLLNEFKFSKNYFQKINLFALYGKSNEAILEENSQVQLCEPVFSSSKNKKSIFIRGIFNWSPFGIHLKELVAVLFSPKKIYWLLVSLFITRATLASKAYKSILTNISGSEKTILYFYWGDNLCWIIPYLRKKTDSDKIKIVLRLHGSDLYEHLKNDYAPLRKIIFNQCDLICTISENGKQYLAQHYPEIENKLLVSRLGVFDHGLNPFKSDVTYYTVISVSNVVTLKRIELIFEVLQHLNLPVTWFHFGDGPLFEKIQTLAKTARIGLKVHLMGHVSNEKIIEFYRSRSLDVFINLSSTEGLPVSIMEALSFGIPVLAPDIGGIGELVNDTNGKLIPAGFSVSNIVLELEKILKAGASKKLRVNARQSFEQKVFADKNYSEFYEKLKSLTN